jgi:hypothetical protein
MLGVLFAAAKTFGTYKVVAMYGGPLLVVNAWLVAYTWLQHTEVDVPHLPAENFTFVKGDDALIYLFVYFNIIQYILFIYLFLFLCSITLSFLTVLKK